MLTIAILICTFLFSVGAWAPRIQSDRTYRECPYLCSVRHWVQVMRAFRGKVASLNFVRRHRLPLCEPPPHHTVLRRTICTSLVCHPQSQQLCEGPSNFLSLQSVIEAAGAVVGNEQSGTNVSRGGPSLHWAIGQEIATKCYQIDVTGVAILRVLCHGTGVASHREVRVTIGLDLLCSGLMTPSYIA